ncbi:pilus assembly protein [Paenibacillus dendritiformis]|uniref:pilus assembly protein n=1 Tax=Paenibacillus dendritiformis TaxID=130049 RepID=UPI0018CFB062|nr:pilus assembly protein [Paenibacillus dendritiformis]
MSTKLRGWLRSVQEEEGSMIVEASLIFPVIFYCTLALLFFAMLIYQTVLSSHAAALAAERAAAFWDNSRKEAVTGAFDAGQHDGMYWRLLDDRLLDKVFGGVGGENHMVKLPAAATGGSLPERKLMRAARLVPDAFHGKMSYENGPLDRRITAALDKPLYQAMFRNIAGRESSDEGQAVSAVVEPAEFIRTVEFARYMAAKLKEWKKQGVPIAEAEGILKQAAGQTAGAS